MRDLSSLAEGSLAVSSMGAGNMVSGNEQAMTAPGSEPVDPLPDRKDQGDPAIGIPAKRPVSDTGRGQPGKSYTPSATTWKTVS